MKQKDVMDWCDLAKRDDEAFRAVMAVVTLLLDRRTSAPLPRRKPRQRKKKMTPEAEAWLRRQLEGLGNRYGPTDPWRLFLGRLGLAVFTAETGKVLDR